MFKKIMIPLLSFTLVFTSLRADISTDTPAPTEEITTTPAQSPEEELTTPSTSAAPEPYHVGAATNEAAQAAKRRQWQNYAIAGLAVAVAATAIYLASTNGGHNE